MGRLARYHPVTVRANVQYLGTLITANVHIYLRTHAAYRNIFQGYRY
jgi:hypothetical protein